MSKLKPWDISSCSELETSSQQESPLCISVKSPAALSSPLYVNFLLILEQDNDTNEMIDTGDYLLTT